ncbi:ribose-5-phosphate isomerase RpiA [Nitrospirales bacterium NOB]|nr:MAG: ribose-5-phosphate isomerase A [Nitrospira sp. OLB3]MBV6469947.1 Ribose-5-phosphate isomerase A [Nitrospirota bacterium]MCE7964647.1 ribose-5-phosphate isomerase RpiA [Nitrospira sp. NTP2]MCK6493934.1 ribose-5-phosphate isomerase RpiA [Nitrospira sp.]MDL1888906.1 ribose-5-phosphate isomerase RpiA [Nitrospirales bacterium NOB]MEB2338257.1 ribose-5-phosphate isomerase RpiA [Nitrospirales bacterium]
MTTTSALDSQKRQAAFRAAEYVQDGMVVGLGTGSTARYLILALGERVRAGLRIQAVPTSHDTAALAKQCGIPLIESDNAWSLDLAIDGADQVDPRWNLVKGGGGALLKEKIVAAAATQFIVMVDHTKLVPSLGGSFPLPIEVVPFGWGSTARHMERISGGRAILRERNGTVFQTEAGHVILDLHIPPIEDPRSLETDLNQIPGIVETGLFIGQTGILIVGDAQGVTVTHASGS